MLDERRAFLGNELHAALILFRQLDGELGYWSEPMLRKLKADRSHRSGVDFSLKTFRATFAQHFINGGARIDAVARAMRHRSSKTTERFCARIRVDDTFHEIERVFDRPEVRLRDG